MFRAIQSGRLSASLTRDKKRIRDVALADAEWAASTKAEMAPLTGPTSPATSARGGSGAAVGRQSDDAALPGNDLAAARARRESAAADMAEIELAKTRGELILAADVEARMADVFARCRTRLLGVPSMLREQDPTLTVEQIDLAERLIHGALEDLADGGAAG